MSLKIPQVFAVKKGEKDNWAISYRNKSSQKVISSLPDEAIAACDIAPGIGKRSVLK